MDKVFMRAVVLFILISISALSIPGLAEENSTPEKIKNEKKEKVKLEEIVVTATRTEKNVDSAPGNVTVVSKEDMNLRNIHTLGDALKYESGIYNQKLRGMSAPHHTLVMLNGMPLNTGWRGHVRWENIAIENVERIEIIRGPSSALYGGNAMGGVINIIASTPEKFEADIQAGYGSNDTLRYSFYFGNRFMDKLNLRFGYESEKTDGYPTNLVKRSISSGTGTLSGGYGTFDKSGKAKWVVGDKGDCFEKKWNVNFNALYDLTDTGSLTFDCQVGYFETGYGPPNTYLLDGNGNPTYSGIVDIGNGKRVRVSPSNYFTFGNSVTKTPSYMLTYKESFGSVGFTGKVGHHSEDKWYSRPKAKGSDNYYNAPGYVKEVDSGVWFTDLQADFAIGDSHNFISGFYYRYNYLHIGRYDLSFYRDEKSKVSYEYDITEGNDRSYAVYLQDEWQITDKLALFTGVRFDYWETFDGESNIAGGKKSFANRDDSALSPKISLVWKPAVDTVIKGSVGRAFRPPSIYELYRNYEMRVGAVYSNPDLEPETLSNYEIGINQYFLDSAAKLSATCFHTDVKDLIYYYVIGDDRFKDNLGEAGINGIELEASIRPLNWLNVWGNYTYNNSKVKKNSHDPKMEGKKITGMPVRTINLGTEVNYKWITAGFTGQYLGRIYSYKYNNDIDGVYGANTKCWLWGSKVTVSPWKHVAISLSVENLFDKEYFRGSIGRCRNFFIKVKLTW